MGEQVGSQDVFWAGQHTEIPAQQPLPLGETEDSNSNEMHGDDGAFDTPGAALSTIVSIVGGAMTGVIVEAFEGTFEGLPPLSTGSGFGGPVQVPCEDDQASLMSAAPMLATISEMPSDLEAGEAGLVVPSASSSVSTASPLRSPSQGEVEGAPSSSPLRLPSQGSIEEIPDGLQQKDSNVEANEPDISGSDL